MPLIRDTPSVRLSPYLAQHADNPVDWYPWEDEAFAVARERDVPVFLSIGYSACHWCHVMAHESFEDERVAALLNQGFVSIKVDREERPDVDAVYMEAVQAMTGSGGWPMSVFLVPDGRPFYGGTYFPPEDRPGMPSFSTVLAAVTDIWQNRRKDVEDQADELAGAITSRTFPTVAAPALSGGAPEEDLITLAAGDLARRFDPEWGGFGGAPKFPTPSLIDLALLHSLRDPGPSGRHSAHMATLTLDAMAAGGIHDHLGGGFARYSTDAQWLVPHFEKMLYDQAGLLGAFLHGWQVTGRPDYLSVVDGIVTYVARDLTDPSGGILASEDADSEGVEGRFYVWTPDEIDRAVSGDIDLGAALTDWFGVTASGNFDGHTILHRPVGAPLSGPDPVERGRARLLATRSQRPRPGRDDKVITEWNAMYGAALAEAAAATGRRDWGSAATGLGEFLWQNLRGEDGRWRRSWRRGGGARHLAYAADHGWLIDLYTRLGELTGRSAWTVRAVDTADALLSLFSDPVDGGFFTTGVDAEALIVRTKDVLDGATPSANAICVRSLARLGAVSGEGRFTAAARAVVDRLGGLLARHPTAAAAMVPTAVHLSEGWTEVVISGDRPDLVGAVQERWSPGAVLAWGEPTGSPLWRGRTGARGYVCRNYSCLRPTEEVDTLVSQLVGATATSPAVRERR